MNAFAELADAVLNRRRVGPKDRRTHRARTVQAQAMTDLTGLGPVTVTDRGETACTKRSTHPPSLSSLLIVQAECPQTETVALAQSSLDINAAARSFVGGVFLVAFCEETAVEQQNQQFM